jgi:spermidine/putrescine transport system ATP-binding protein
MQLELKTLQREVGITFIYVTHDQEEALTMSDRIAVMSRGVALQVGAPEEIYERPANRFVADFIGETNFIDGTVLEQVRNMVTMDVPGTAKLQIQTSRTFAKGQSVAVTVRPEKLRLDAELTGGNNLSGRLEDVIYIGTDTHFGVRFAGGQKVQAGSRTSHMTGAVAEGVHRPGLFPRR